MDYKKLIEIIRNSDCIDFGIRHLCKDENYNVGYKTRNSYDWDYVCDCSTYETDDPVELMGVCAYDTCIDSISDTDEQIIKKLEDAMNNSKCYDGTNVVLLGSGWCTYGRDTNEIIMPEATVLYKFEECNNE